jgi:hypothetical protein
MPEKKPLVVATFFTPKIKARLRVKAKAKANPTKAKVAGMDKKTHTTATQCLLLPTPLCPPSPIAHQTPPPVRGQLGAPSTQLHLSPNPHSMQDVNPEKPYWYCYFHGWNFTHKGLLWKKIRHAFNMDKLHAVNPTSTTPHGNASVEPA